MSAELGGIEKSLITFLQYIDTIPDIHVTLMLWKKKGELLSSIPQNINIIDAPTSGNLLSIIKQLSIPRLLTYVKLKYFTQKGTPWLAFKHVVGHYDIAISYTQDGYSPYYVIDKVDADRKYMWYHHGAYLHNGRLKKLDELYYPKFTKVIPVSESIKKILCAEFPSCKTQFEVIPNLLNEIDIKKQALEPCIEFAGINVLKLVTVGRLSTEKGQSRALDVAKKLKTNGIPYKWIFVGDGPDKSSCLQKCEYLQIQDCVSFIGAKNNPYKYIKHADIYVAPSYIEADPVTIQEAIILKKPIVASDIASITNALRNSDYHKMVDFANTDIVANTIRLLYDNLHSSDFDTPSTNRNNYVLSKLKQLLDI